MIRHDINKMLTRRNLDVASIIKQCHSNILGRVVRVYVHIPFIIFRFWLSRAIEGFLRGSVSPPDQYFLMNRGLIKVSYHFLLLQFFFLAGMIEPI